MKNIDKQMKETNHDYALRVIRENIINLELQPGSMISEQDIANELNLSRTPVHEALQELAHTKIIEILPQRGSLVTYIDLSLIDEAVFMRATIESAVAFQACQMATDKDLVDLEENLNLQEFYLSKNNIDKFLQLDNGFHEIMYKIANKMQCHYMVTTMNIHHDRYRQLRMQTSDPTPIIAEHRKIFDAFKNKDSETARKLILSHLSRKLLDEKELQEKFPHYFKAL